MWKSSQRKKRLNIDFGLKNESQDCKIGTVGDTCGRGG
jgi:hypothetical protein